jgi:hypothetical protein
MAKKDHIHKYFRDKLGKQFIYRCMLPGCPHYILAKLVLGRESLCNYCDTKFVIDKHNATLKKPHCPDCVVVHNAKPRPVMERPMITAADFLEKILPTIPKED